MSTRTAVQRRLSAIMFTDIVGFSRLMGQDEGNALRVLDAQRELVPPLVTKFDGRILKEMGDGLLVEFASTVHAVQCALEIQDAIRLRNEGGSLPFQIRIGIHLGDVVVMGDDILGEGVNIASRIEPLASPGGICVTQAVYQSVKSTLPVDGERIDAVRLKNIDEEYTLYTIPRSDTAPAAQKGVSSEFARVRVERVDDATETRREVTRIARWIWIPQLLLTLAFLVPGRIVGALRGPGSFTQSLVEDFSALTWPATSGFLAAVLILVAIEVLAVSYLLHRRTVTLSLADVRHVGLLLDMLIVRMRYGLQSQKGKVMEYLHVPMPWKQRPRFAWVKWVDTMTVSFDGNRVTVEGPHFHVHRLLKTLRRYEPADRGTRALPEPALPGPPAR